MLTVPPIELVDRVLAADEAEDDESIDKILCGALKSLKTVRAKPSPALYLGLMYLAKVKPMFFESENVIEVTRSAEGFFHSITKIMFDFCSYFTNWITH